jgi:hypothetical protein
LPNGDIVVDANVFAHACNPSESYFESALALVLTLADAATKLALDDTGKQSPDEWTSNLYREYSECIPPMSLSAAVVAALLSSGRATFYPRPNRELWRKCRAFASRNNNDAILLGIGVACSSHVIITNDYRDFPLTVRRAIARDLKVLLQDSDECAAA